MYTDSLKAITDTTAAAHEQASQGSGWILHHVTDGRYLDFTPFGKIDLPVFNIGGYELAITRHTIFMWVAAIILLIMLIKTAQRYKKTKIPNRFTGAIEVLILFVRDEIAKPSIGSGYEKFVPYLLTTFFFILFANFLGLIPFSATVTSNISLTATLAAISFVVTQWGGMKKNGVFGYFKGLIPHGIPVFLLPIMIVVEVLGLFTKPFALAVRLFANMIAGHIVIYALIGLIFAMGTLAVAPVSVGMALFINLLEILVASLQAYIFTMLSAVFIGMAVHQEH
ncbi:MAG: F0F1 ATP synthase subunit A [Ignavibacteriales bacterium]|nr:MAG: F0F1 ATP synthase subunit A [Ignavibacteriaceae bacterium]MBW7873964.1 F0F1 ATP synthase subunit A [Ignavibacteria bacterium]MCZ2143277.1 F0F1 ATP synthase subunit A [Ignavibacteriales bacterium]OQY77244.1 MAG: ATP synthase F0 subunit A [Ignavibacteriales bacterium UTCHB3]MBV6444159.1 ATP synthase subunit a [Ignavibacteriaceae bacterium]